jgi:DNA invertase Pin-like site-specific DNA recombinase
MIRKAETALIPAAAYIRMSGRQQEKSPDEQRAEITKLATREGFSVVEWFADEAITGDSSTEDRAGLAAMLNAAKAGKFKVIVAWHTNRISREDPMDAIVLYNQLRKAGVGLHTCCEGAIDLDDFAKQLLLFVNQKGNKDYLIEHSAKTLRGKIANAKAGGRNGGRAIFGLDRGLFDSTGHLVRRLLPGEHVHMAGHRVQLLPSTDKMKIDAVRFAFQRFDTADIGLRDLAREMEAKGYPSPTGRGWTHENLGKLFKTAAYVGTSRWGSLRRGKYHVSQGDEIVAIDKTSAPVNWRKKPEEDLIVKEKASEGIIPKALFKRVQAKRNAQERRLSRGTRHADYPLTGLIFCEHCGEPMHGTGKAVRNRGRRLRYICSTYASFGPRSLRNTTCGHHIIDAQRVLGWLVWKLQEVYLGPGRDVLVKEIRRQLAGEAKTSAADRARLEKRAGDLDREVSRLVKAIRTVDAAELVEELQIVRGERDRVRAELAQAGRLTDPLDLDAEAERIADSLSAIGEQLTTEDPAILREVLRQFVARITCRWGYKKPGKRASYPFLEGKVELRPQTPFSVCGVVATTWT